jgi:hypothetical protein
MCEKSKLDERPSMFIRDKSSRQRGCYIRTITARVQLERIFGSGSQGARRQDKLIGCKQPLIK